MPGLTTLRAFKKVLMQSVFVVALIALIGFGATTVAAQGQRDQSMLRVEERQDARGRTYFWIGFKRIFSDPEPGTDLRAMVEGQISVTPLHMNLTELKEHQRLHALIDGPMKALSTPMKAAAQKMKKPLEETKPGRSRRANET